MGCCCCCVAEHDVIKDSKRQAPVGDGNVKRYFQNQQGLWIRWRLWKLTEPSDEPVVGVVLLVHGFAEHLGRYEHFAKHFNSRGMVVVGMDHQGHGLSEGDRGYVQAFSHYVDDVVQFATSVLPAELAGTAAEGKRVVLFGHSMGGLIASHVLLRSQSLFAGAIISAPAALADPKIATPAMRSLSARLSNVFPKLAMDKLDPENVSRDKECTAAYAKDPLVYHGGLRIRWGNEMLQAMDQFWKDAAKVTLPVLLIHGTGDKIVPFEASEKYLAAVSSADKTLKRYEGFYHECFNDPGKEAVLKDMTDFAAKVLS